MSARICVSNKYIPVAPKTDTMFTYIKNTLKIKSSVDVQTILCVYRMRIIHQPEIRSMSGPF